MVKDKITFSSTALPSLFARLTDVMSDARSNTLDGLKLEWSDRWLLVRGSNTEPIVRLIAEAPTTAQARQLCDQGMQVAASMT
jgi:phosphomannomutase